MVPPPSATIHVVTPDHLVFSIKNWRSWILEVGRRYEIVIQVVSTQRMQIYSSDNLVIESQFDAGKFGVNYQSANGSYNYVAAREKGVTVARASLKGTRALLSGEIIQFDWVARGEQEIELLDPIDVRNIEFFRTFLCPDYKNKNFSRINHPPLILSFVCFSRKI